MASADCEPRDREESEEDEDEEEEEVEPKLQYERLSNDVPQILKKDAASCLAVHTKLLALGTHSGVVYLLDHQGNTIRTSPLHATTVNQIAFDDGGDHIICCSDDCKVVILGLYNGEHNRVITMSRPVQAVALDPEFYKAGSGRRFIVGDDKVTLHEKGLLSRYKDSVLHQGEGPVRNVRWKGQFIAWATDMNARVFDVNSKQIIARIKKEFEGKSEEHRCNLFWKDANTLLVGWGDTIEICVIRQRSLSQDASLKGLPDYYVEIVSMFSTSTYINGIGPMGDMIVVLTLLKNHDLQSSDSRPQLQVLEATKEEHNDVSRDILAIKSWHEYRCNDYHLESLPEEGLFFILSPKDIVMAKPRDEDDHVAWLIEHQKFEEAMEVVSSSRTLKRHNLLNTGRIYLNQLLNDKNYSAAAQLCVKILGRSKSFWEEEVYRFAHIQQLRAIAPYLPKVEPRLDPAIYEMVLNEYLQVDPKEFVKVIRQWPSDLYNISAIVNAVLDRLSIDPVNETLLEGLSELYTYEQKYDKALTIYLRIGNKTQVFKLIRQHGLFASIHDKLEILMELNAQEATCMLLDNTDKIPVDMVVAKLHNKTKLLYTYLDRLFHKDAELCQEHHGLMVQLYAEYAQGNLLPFLQSSNNYPLELALDICLQRRLMPEAIFLLGRMGNTKQALQMIIDELKNIDEAIKFCKEHDDRDLWEDLINSSMDKPEFIKVLLKNIGSHVDPIILIQKIAAGMEIPELQNALVTILQDYNLQISLREGCKKILVSDCFGLLDKLNRQQKRGIQVTDDQFCQACQRKVIENDARYSGDIRIFFCRHAFHENCLPTEGMEHCTICSAQKRRPGGTG